MLWIDNDYGQYKARVSANPTTAEEHEAFCREYYPKGTPDMDPGTRSLKPGKRRTE